MAEPVAGATSSGLMASGLTKRVLSALVMVPVALAAVYFGGGLFDLLVVAAALVMLFEWNRITKAEATDARWGAPFVRAAIGLFAPLLVAALKQPEIGLLLLAVVTLPLAVLAAWEEGRGRGWGAFGTLYIGLPCVTMIWLRQDDQAGLAVVVWMLAVVWATDTGAYFAGRTIGGPKLAPRISPNKTWAGLLGGMAAAAAVGVVAGALIQHLAIVPLALLSAALAAWSQVGDLTESWVKRHFGVKDSGSIIPGHGGVLDRVDGLLFVAPVVALLSWLTDGGLP
jgi:phosphatidate cytidylyltransferase